MSRHYKDINRPMSVVGTGIPLRIPQDHILSTKEIYLPQRDKGQGLRNKNKR